MSRLVDEARALLGGAAALYADQPAVAGGLAALRARLDEPLRVALAGKVKAGKSTLLNALVGEELAPTGATECTRIVTWYRDGPTYRVTLHPADGGAPRPVPFTRDDGALDVDLGGLAPEAVDRLDVEWPCASLRAATLVDTPGIASLTTALAERTHAFLTGEGDVASPADAVVYLLRHLHESDVRILEAFRDDEAAPGTPVNAIGVLSRADEVAGGRLDAMDAAARVAERYRTNPVLRTLCQTVVPVAGLLAVAGGTLRDAEFRAVHALASAAAADVDPLLLSADRFANAESPVLDVVARRAVLDRLGVFGVRLAVELARTGRAPTADALAGGLRDASGLAVLRDLLATQFASRADVLKARTALGALDALVRTAPVPGAAALAADVERVVAGAHELTELALLAEIRAGEIALRPEELAGLERLLGATGTSPAARLGLEGEGDGDVRAALHAALARWHEVAGDPLLPRAAVDAARAAVRTCEGLYATLA